MNIWNIICFLVTSTLQLSRTGIYEIKVGLNYGDYAGNQMHSIFTRIQQFNNITDLIHPEAKITIVYERSGGSKLGTVKAGFSFNEKKTIAVFGTGSSELTELLSKTLWYRNIPQCCFSSTSASLSNKTLFPNFFRTVPNDDYQGRAIIQFALKKGWKRLSVICIFINR